MFRKRSASSDADPEKKARIDAILQEVARETEDGVSVDTAAIEREHPDLMPELGECLRGLRAIEDARERMLREAQSAQHRAPHEAWLEQDLEFLRQALDNYEVFGRLRHGGQGVVYAAHQKGANRLVAIKVLLDGPLASERQQQRFEREIELIARLQHPNIIRLYDTGTVRGRRFFAMEYVEGMPLHDYALGADLTPRQIVRLFVKVCRAVSYAHQNGVIHRDLGPSNILVSEDGEPHIFDFGLAKDVWASDHGAGHSLTGQVFGTLPFLSPEQAGGLDGKVDVRSDIYTLGVVLYLVLTDGFPYPTDRTPHEVRSAIISTDAEPLRKAAARGGDDRIRELATIDRDLEVILGKVLAKEKEARYQSAAALADDLERWLNGEAITARADSHFYLLRKTIRRYRVAVGVTAVIFLTLAFSWVQVRAQRDNARAAARAAFNLFEKAYDFEESARRLAGGVALRDELVGQLSEEIPEFETLVGADQALDPIRVRLLEKQGDLAFEQGQRADAARFYEAFLEEGRRLAESAPSESAYADGVVRAYRKYAEVSDDPPGFYERGIRQAEEVLSRNPQRDEARYNLCQAHVAFGEYLLKSELYEAALEQFDGALAQYDPEEHDGDQRWMRIAAIATSARGRILLKLGNVPGGISQLERALRIRESISKTRPTDAIARHDLMMSYVYVASAEREAGHTDRAVELLEKAGAAGELLRTMDPTVAAWGLDLYAVYDRLVRLRLTSGDVVGAQAGCDAAAALAEDLLTIDPESPKAQSTLAFARILRGRVLLDSNSAEEAYQSFAIAAAIRESLMVDHPEDPAHRDDFAVAHSWLGKSARCLKKHRQAVKHYQVAYDVRKGLYGQQPDVVDRSLALIKSETNLAVAHLDHETQRDDTIAEQLLRDAEDRLQSLLANGKLAGLEEKYQSWMSKITHNQAILRDREDRRTAPQSGSRADAAP